MSRERLSHLFTASMLALMLGIVAVSYTGWKKRIEADNRTAKAIEDLAKATRENTLATKELSKLCERLP